MEMMRMFPLGHPLIPFTLVSLRIFEPRYVQMIAECRADTSTFGVVLIERGFEVGGGDVRAGVGTVAQIVEVSDLPDGEQAVVAVGIERLDIVEWLSDGPYPRAIVERSLEKAAPGSVDRIAAIDKQLRVVLSLLSEAGIDTGPLDYRLSDQAEVAAHQMCGLAPVGAFDAQRLLAAQTTEDRLDLLASMLDEQRDLLMAQLGGGSLD
ncbi:MAG: LON peptidase substrate-binding domain-containing protein [Acidimicrobiia bacterium]|nr:LON peptidase substrate-binding domain-containing protein [Acidimicrobiia bacterium]